MNPNRIRSWWSRLRELVAPANTMRASDHARWAAAGSLADVADLTAAWLSGDLRSQPNYNSPVDTDETAAPGMTEALIALNRTGVVVTTDSQAAGETWSADVHGFIRADLADRLADLVTAAGLTFTRQRPTRFGTAGLPHSEIADERVGYGICRRSAITDLQKATQFAIHDPQPNRNTVLWPTLRWAACRLPNHRPELRSPRWN